MQFAICGLWKNLQVLIYSKFHEKKQSARMKCKNNSFKTVRSVKTTAYDQNNNIQWYFHIFKAQKSSKSGQTVQGIVQSVSESLSMKWNRRFRGLTMFVFNFGVGFFCTELPENCIYLNQSELSNFFILLIT